MSYEVLTKSPQEVDPLSWFAGPFLPLSFAAAAGLIGTLFILVTAPHRADPLLLSLANVVFIAACILIQRSSRPGLGIFRPRSAVLPLLLSWVGAGFSAASYTKGTAGIDIWWAPLGVAIVIAALAPYSSAIALIVYGLSGTVVCGLIATIAFGGGGGWPIVSTVLMGSLLPLQATVASAVFSAYIVNRVTRWLEIPKELIRPRGLGHNFAQWEVQHNDLGPLSDRVTPFIERIAREGKVSQDDRHIAASLAEEIRAGLVATANRSWLDSLAGEHRFSVVDADHRAGQMTLEQRSAVRGLIEAVAESPVLEPDSLRIELRYQPDGTTAVALSMKLDLPEGKRMLLLAPYYLTLKVTVDELQWAGGEELRMRFQLPK